MQEAGTVGVGSWIVGIHVMGNRVGSIAILRMVEEVEDFPPELEPGVLANGEALKRADVKVDATRQEQRVAPDSAERQTGRQSEGRGIGKQWPAGVREFGRGQARMRIADQVGSRTSACAIADACVVAERGAVGDG